MTDDPIDDAQPDDDWFVRGCEVFGLDPASSRPAEPMTVELWYGPERISEDHPPTPLPPAIRPRRSGGFP